MSFTYRNDYAGGKGGKDCIASPHTQGVGFP